SPCRWSTSRAWRPSSISGSTRRAAVTEPRLGRRDAVRRLVAAAGLGPVVLAFLEDAVPALAHGDETDAAVLHAALVLEHEAIAIYDLGLRERLFPSGWR